MKIGKWDITWAKIGQSWEVRSLRFIFRLFAYLLLILYVIMGGRATVEVLRLHHARAYPVEALSGVIDSARAKGDPAAATRWISRRPLSETDKIIEIATPLSGHLEPQAFYLFSARLMRQEKVEEAFFWTQLGHYRLRYDALRCGADKSAKNLSALMVLLSPPEVEKMLQENPRKVPRSIQEVLDFDAKYPAENALGDSCGMIRHLEAGAEPLPKEIWPQVRESLRTVSAFAVKDMEDELNKKE